MNDLIVIGLAGVASAGKTTIAEVLCPGYYTQILNEKQELIPIVWNKLFFAMPIKKIASILKNTQGDNSFSRQNYQVHEELKALVGDIITYDELVDMCYEICSQEIPTDTKPRKFLQWIGDLLRDCDKDVFVNWMRRQILFEYSLFKKNQEEYDIDLSKQKLGIVIDDMRFPNEIDLVKSYNNNLIVKLTVDPAEAKRRTIARDGIEMADTEISHISEQINTYPNDLFDIIIDTTITPPKEITKQVLNELNPNQFQSFVFIG